MADVTMFQEYNNNSIKASSAIVARRVSFHSSVLDQPQANVVHDDDDMGFTPLDRHSTDSNELGPSVRSASESSEGFNENRFHENGVDSSISNSVRRCA